VYAQCRVAAEPRLGQIKQARGFRQLFLRGLQKARGVWNWGHNQYGEMGDGDRWVHVTRQ